MANPPPPPPTPPSEPITINGSAQDAALLASSHLTRQEVLARRSRRVKQLAQIYRTHYWALMEELKYKHKEYYWKYGKSPFKEDEKKKNDNKKNRACENGEWNGKLGFQEEEVEEGVRKCVVGRCKAKAMALTSYCHPHILLDTNQKLYKGCTFVVKSAQGRPVLCRKPTLRSTVPSLCPTHFQKAEIYVTQALKKAGHNATSPSELAPKFHVIVAEFVRQIQTKRRAAKKENVSDVQIKDNKTS